MLEEDRDLQGGQVRVRHDNLLARRIAGNDARGERLLHDIDPQIDAKLERIERSVRILEEIERLRLNADGETWEKVSAIVEARMEIDRKLD